MADYIRCHNCGSTFRIENPNDTEIRCRNCGVMLDFTNTAAASAEPPVMDLIDLETPPEPQPEQQPYFAAEKPLPQKPPEPPGVFEGKTFWLNMLRFLVPFRGLGELMTFLFIFVLAFAMPFVSQMCCIGMIAAFMIAGYLCSFCFNLVVASAEGEDKLPEPESFFDAMNNFWSDIADPFFKFVGSFTYVYTPAFLTAVIYVQFTRAHSISESAPIHTVLAILIGIGTFLWPISLLIFACNDWLCLAKPHWIIMSILRIWPAYLAACAVMFALAAGGYYVLVNLHLDILEFGFKIIIFWLIAVYLIFYAMRITGLLFRHYQQKIAMELK